MGRQEDNKRELKISNLKLKILTKSLIRNGGGFFYFTRVMLNSLRPSVVFNEGGFQHLVFLRHSEVLIEGSQMCEILHPSQTRVLNDGGKIRMTI